MRPLDGVRGLLLDIDGTLLLHDRPAPGAADLIVRLRASAIPFRVTTNTTRRSRSACAEALRRAGVDVAPEEILTPAVLARRRIQDSRRTRALLLLPEQTRGDMDGLHEPGTAPDWVVVGDLGRGFTWDRLNGAFRCLRAGAGLIALHRNRWWDSPEDGIVLDAGAFVSALEYASGVAAELVGKPSPSFFALALSELGRDAPALRPGEVLVVGDDPESDAAGGAAAGCRTALVATGKLSGSPGAPAGSRTDFFLGSLAELL